MKVYCLDFRRKILNRIKLFSTSLILLSLPVVGWAIVTNSKNEIYYLLFAFIFFIVYLITSAINIALRSYIKVENSSKYTLSLNAIVPLSSIEEKWDLRYSKNFLVKNDEPRFIVELDRNQAYKLIANNRFSKVDTKIEPQKLSFIELNPNGLMEFILYLTSA